MFVIAYLEITTKTDRSTAISTADITITLNPSIDDIGSYQPVPAME
jgi:hypothetical protein